MPLEIDQLRQRIDVILSRVAPTPELRTPAIESGFEELRHVLSEFVTSGEELYLKIEELVHARNRLELDCQRYRELFERAPDAHIVTDFDSHIRLANQAAASLLQVRADTLASQSLLLFIGEADRESVLEHVAEVREQSPGAPQQWRLMIRPRQEEIIPAIVTITPIEPTNASEAGLHWVLREGTNILS